MLSLFSSSSSSSSSSFDLLQKHSLSHSRPTPSPQPRNNNNNNNNSSVDLCKWDCRLPGKEGTEWAGGSFPLTLEFSADDYPAKPPKAKFPAGFFHPNIYPSGTVCLSILNEDEGWRPSLTVRNVLLGIQELLSDPNPKSPAQSDAYVLFVKEPSEYKKRVKAQTARYPPPS
jgi:ubiquitin-conjugating enzyme E2 I